MELSRKERERLFINELRSIIIKEITPQIPAKKDIHFKELYKILEPTFEMLRNKYHLDENPIGTNSEVVLFHSTLFSIYYNNKVMSKKKENPIELLTHEMTKLFDEHEKYRYPDGKIIYYNKGPNLIQKIKRDILQEFDMIDNEPVLFKVKYLLNMIRPRFM